MGKQARTRFGKTALDWIVRFVKFNIVGFVVFLVGTAIFAFSFHAFGAWSWVLASASGGILQFVLISILNRTRKGQMFDGCEPKQATAKN